MGEALGVMGEALEGMAEGIAVTGVYRGKSMAVVERKAQLTGKSDDDDADDADDADADDDDGDDVDDGDGDADDGGACGMLVVRATTVEVLLVVKVMAFVD